MASSVAMGVCEQHLCVHTVYYKSTVQHNKTVVRLVFYLTKVWFILKREI